MILRREGGLDHDQDGGQTHLRERDRTGGYI